MFFFVSFFLFCFYYTAPEQVQRFHGNHSHPDHFKLLETNGDSILVGARYIFLLILRSRDFFSFGFICKNNNFNFLFLFLFTCRNIIYNLSLNEMTENRAQVSYITFGAISLLDFLVRGAFVTMPSKKRKRKKKNERKRWSGKKKKKKRNRGQKTVTHPVIRMFETRHAYV
jgi:hypothetical protein